MKFLIALLLLLPFLSCSPKLSPDHSWGNQRWILVEMKEVPVQLSGTNRDAYLQFTPGDKHFSGNGGCNHISGNYTLEKKNEISFGDVISTKMSCPDLAFEESFISTLGKVTRFTMNGNQILLKRGNEVLLILESK